MVLRGRVIGKLRNWGSLLALLLLTSSVSVVGQSHASQHKPCTRAEAVKAEQEAGYLKNWNAVYASFGRYHHCDSGATAEGYSDTIAKLFANEWRNVETAKRLMTKDSLFASSC